ncbi:MAG: hypothetical protein ACYDCI_10280 [Candidatus Limnocylindrales bacterium]
MIAQALARGVVVTDQRGPIVHQKKLESSVSFVGDLPKEVRRRPTLRWTLPAVVVVLGIGIVAPVFQQATSASMQPTANIVFGIVINLAAFVVGLRAVVERIVIEHVP